VEDCGLEKARDVMTSLACSFAVLAVDIFPLNFADQVLDQMKEAAVGFLREAVVLEAVEDSKAIPSDT
jgi:hypothetical protein